MNKERFWAVQGWKEKRGWYTAWDYDGLAIFLKKTNANKYMKKWKEWCYGDGEDLPTKFRIIELVIKNV